MYKTIEYLMENNVSLFLILIFYQLSLCSSPDVPVKDTKWILTKRFLHMKGAGRQSKGRGKLRLRKELSLENSQSCG